MTITAFVTLDICCIKLNWISKYTQRLRASDEDKRMHHVGYSYSRCYESALR